MGTCIRRMDNVLLVNISLMPEYMSLIKCFTSLSALREHSEARFCVSEQGCGSDCLGSDSTVCAVRVSIKKLVLPAPVAHTCHPSYSGGRDQEHQGLKRPHLENAHHKKGWWSCSMCRP
jgi:hypothetical protein